MTCRLGTLLLCSLLVPYAYLSAQDAAAPDVMGSGQILSEYRKQLGALPDGDAQRMMEPVQAFLLRANAVLAARAGQRDAAALARLVDDAARRSLPGFDASATVLRQFGDADVEAAYGALMDYGKGPEDRVPAMQLLIPEIRRRGGLSHPAGELDFTTGAFGIFDRATRDEAIASIRSATQDDGDSQQQALGFYEALNGVESSVGLEWGRRAVEWVEHASDPVLRRRVYGNVMRAYQGPAYAALSADPNGVDRQGRFLILVAELAEATNDIDTATWAVEEVAGSRCNRPENLAAVLFWQAKAYLDRNDEENALVTARKALDFNNNGVFGANAGLLLGKIQEAMEDFPGAAKTYIALLVDHGTETEQAGQAQARLDWMINSGMLDDPQSIAAAQDILKKHSTTRASISAIVPATSHGEVK